MERHTESQVHPAILSALGVVKTLGKAESARHIHWVCYVGQELGRMDREFDFAMSGSEVFSRELDASIAICEAAGLLRDTGAPQSLVVTSAADDLQLSACESLESVARLDVDMLVAIGRLIWLQRAGVGNDQLRALASSRFFMPDDVIDAALDRQGQLAV